MSKASFEGIMKEYINKDFPKTEMAQQIDIWSFDAAFSLVNKTHFVNPELTAERELIAERLIRGLAYLAFKQV